MKALSFSLFLYGSALAYDVFPVTIHAATVGDLQMIMSNSSYDFGCRPIALPTDAGAYELHALLSEEQYGYLKTDYKESEIRVERVVYEKRRATAPIGTGDRFKSGTVAPLGLGTRSSGVNYDLGGIMNVAEISSAVNALAKEYGIGTFTTPYTTVEGATGFGGSAGGGTDKSNYHIYFTAGMHARERGGPDNLIYFISDLLYANRTGVGLTYGKKTYTNADVVKVLSAGIVFFPLVNPDGVTYDQKTSSSWRKNRNTASATSGNARSIGVDVNRNFNFLWDYTRYFSSSQSPASNNPSDETFYGKSAFSEAESKNVASVYDQFTKIRWFLDIHSAAGTVLYSWGDDDNQSTSPTQNFLNSAYDGKRGVVSDSAYKEYIDQTDWNNVKSVAVRTTTAMKAVGGRSYTPQQAVGLYPTSGASDDYAFSRSHANSTVNKVYGYTMEFGYSTNFYPTTTEFQQNVIDTNAGFMDFILGAVEVGLT